VSATTARPTTVDAATASDAGRPPTIDDAAPWPGPWRRYDLLKELVIAVVVVAVLTVTLAIVFGSPDDRSISLAAWAKADSNDFVATTVAELNGTSGTASYGAPYNTAGPGQKLGPLSLQKWAGTTVPVDAARDFVVRPLAAIPGDPELTSALAEWNNASPSERESWSTAYGDALTKAPSGDPGQVPAGDYGPVPVMAGRLLALARSGGLDGALVAQGGFYQLDYTKSLLFLADGSYLESRARQQQLGGDQWGMMNETGRYPGQAWLWLYTFWYQVKPFSTSGNADALVWGLMALLTLGLVLVPFIPGIRSIPKYVPVHRLIWRDWNRSKREG
jgi:hypothetical protein